MTPPDRWLDEPISIDEPPLPASIELACESGQYSIPTAATPQDFARLVAEKVLPGLARAKKLAGDVADITVDLAFLHYIEASDAFKPGVARQLARFFFKAGLAPSDSPKELDHVWPERINLLGEMRENPDQYIPMAAFRKRKYLIGPMSVGEAARNEMGLVSYRADGGPTQPHFHDCIAVAGETLLRGFKTECDDRVTFGEICRIIAGYLPN